LDPILSEKDVGRKLVVIKYLTPENLIQRTDTKRVALVFPNWIAILFDVHSLENLPA
jgi:hypothetical protein